MARLKGPRVNLDNTFRKFARKMEGILKAQAPYKTGALRNSIRVIANKEGLQIVLTPIDGKDNYGRYLHQGTGPERVGPYSRDFEEVYMALMGKKWDENPGRGRGGIKPRYFLNIADVEYERFNDQLAREYAKAAEQYIQSIIEDGLKL